MIDTANLGGLRVLVVEDEMMVSMLIEDMLTDLGCTVIGPASRLDEAFDLARAADVDCAVLDVNLTNNSRAIAPLKTVAATRWSARCLSRPTPASVSTPRQMVFTFASPR